MKRVAIQLTSTGGFYGAERTLVELAAYLADQGWESHVIALEGQGAGEVVRRARDRGLSATAYAQGSRLSVTSLLVKLRVTLRRFPHAIVHSHGYKPDILLAALGVPRRLGCMATCHTWYSDTLKMKLTERLDKRVLRRFDHVVAVSDEIRSDLLDGGVSADVVSMIDNGISVPPCDPSARESVRSEFAIAPSEHLLVQIGRLAKSKRNELVLEAVARLNGTVPVRVLLVGEGDQEVLLQEKARALGIVDRVTFCGYRNDAHRILAAADLFALTSNKEGLPIVILEAMAVGCPIVSTAVGAIPAVLRDHENARLVPAEDVERLTSALSESLTDPTAANVRAEQARADFMTRFSRDAMGQRYLDVYNRIWHARGWT